MGAYFISYFFKHLTLVKLRPMHGEACVCCTDCPRIKHGAISIKPSIYINVFDVSSLFKVFTLNIM